jgi:hypothetical protein
VSGSSFRPSTIADEPEIEALLHESLGLSAGHPMVERSHLHWKYWEPRADWPGSRSYVYLQGGQIVAHGAVVPCVCLWREHRITALQVIDWAAKRELSGTGVALLKQIRKLGDATFSVGGNELTTQRILPLIGFKDCGTTVTYYARPIRPLQRLANPAYRGWRLLPQVTRAVFWTLTASSRCDVEWSAHPVPADQLAGAALLWPTPTYGAKYGTTIFERSNPLMSYWLRCPATPMELYSVHAGGRNRGYFLLAFAAAQARIADCWIDSDDLSDWTAAVQLAVIQAKAHPEVAEVVTMTSDPMLGAALVQSGFRIRRAGAMWWHAAGGMAGPDATIRYMMADTDEAYLHDGRGTLWA